jgi:hypothetical protein
VVISHDCEYTKVRQRGIEWPMLVAPALSVDEILKAAGLDRPGQDGQVRGNQFRYLFYLKPEGNVPELVVDLRLIQPVTAHELLGADLVASMGTLLKLAFQDRIGQFLIYRAQT